MHFPLFQRQCILLKLISFLEGQLQQLCGNPLAHNAHNVIFNIILMKFLGVAGIALSTALVYGFSCVMLATYLFRTIGHLENEDADKGRAVA